MFESFESMELQEGIRFELRLLTDKRPLGGWLGEVMLGVVSDAETETPVGGFVLRVVGVGLHSCDVAFNDELAALAVVAGSFSLSELQVVWLSVSKTLFKSSSDFKTALLVLVGGFFIISLLVFSFLLAKFLFIGFEPELPEIPFALLELVVDVAVAFDALRDLFDETGVALTVILEETLLLDEFCVKGVLRLEELIGTLLDDPFDMSRLLEVVPLESLVGMRCCLSVLGVLIRDDDAATAFFVSAFTGNSGLLNSIISLLA